VACNELDRLARSTTDLLRIVDDLDRRGVGLMMLSMGRQRIDTRSPTGKLMITMLAAIASSSADFCWSVSGRVSPKRSRREDTKGSNLRHVPRLRGDQIRC
jgi:hypothetical protein